MDKQTCMHSQDSFPDIRMAVLRKKLGMIVYISQLQVILNIFWQGNGGRNIYCSRPTFIKKTNNARKMLTSRAPDRLCEKKRNGDFAKIKS